MNEGLFEKYKKVLTQKQVEKKEVIEILKSISGIEFKEEELSIQKRIISLYISSAKKSIFIQKNIKDKLQERGYSIKL